jgi:hypothetical protein
MIRQSLPNKHREPNKHPAEILRLEIQNTEQPHINKWIPARPQVSDAKHQTVA